MTSRHQYFCSKLYSSDQAMTPLHGGATNGLLSMTRPHYSDTGSEQGGGGLTVNILTLMSPLAHT